MDALLLTGPDSGGLWRSVQQRSSSATVQPCTLRPRSGQLVQSLSRSCTTMVAPPAHNGQPNRSAGSHSGSDHSRARSVQLPPAGPSTLPNGAPVNAFAAPTVVQETARVSVDASSVSSSDEDAQRAHKSGAEGPSSEEEASAAPASVHGSVCAICFERPWDVAIGECSHQLCMQCAQGICYKSPRLPSCPFCRAPIRTFVATSAAQ